MTEDLRGPVVQRPRAAAHRGLDQGDDMFVGGHHVMDLGRHLGVGLLRPAEQTSERVPAADGLGAANLVPFDVVDNGVHGPMERAERLANQGRVRMVGHRQTVCVAPGTSTSPLAGQVPLKKLLIASVSSEKAQRAAILPSLMW